MATGWESGMELPVSTQGLFTHSQGEGRFWVLSQWWNASAGFVLTLECALARPIQM